MILYLLYGQIIGFYGFGRISTRLGSMAAQRCSFKQIFKFLYGDPKALIVNFFFFANFLQIFANFEVLLAAKNYLCFALL